MLRPWGRNSRDPAARGEGAQAQSGRRPGVKREKTQLAAAWLGLSWRRATCFHENSLIDRGKRNSDIFKQRVYSEEHWCKWSITINMLSAILSQNIRHLSNRKFCSFWHFVTPFLESECTIYMSQQFWRWFFKIISYRKILVRQPVLAGVEACLWRMKPLRDHVSKENFFRQEQGQKRGWSWSRGWDGGPYPGFWWRRRSLPNPGRQWQTPTCFSKTIERNMILKKLTILIFRATKV